MRRMSLSTLTVAAGLVLSSAPAFAADPSDDAAKLYDVSFEAPPKVKAGTENKLVVKITPKGAAEIHKEAPVSLKTTGKNLTPSKEKVGRDALVMEGHNASFTVPFTAQAAGAGQLDADLSFYICTNQVCARQQKKATLPVAVE